MIRARLARRGGDHGSVSIMVAVGLVAVVMFIGLSVDGGGQIRESQLAQQYAAEAARAGGQRIDLLSAIAGSPATLATPCSGCQDPTTKCVTNEPYSMAASNYVAVAAAEDKVQVTGVCVVWVDADTLSVTVQLQYTTYLLGSFGFAKHLSASGSATAELVTTA